MKMEIPATLSSLDVDMIVANAKNYTRGQTKPHITPEIVHAVIDGYFDWVQERVYHSPKST